MEEYVLHFMALSIVTLTEEKDEITWRGHLMVSTLLLQHMTYNFGELPIHYPSGTSGRQQLNLNADSSPGWSYTTEH